MSFAGKPEQQEPQPRIYEVKNTDGTRGGIEPHGLWRNYYEYKDLFPDYIKRARRPNLPTEQDDFTFSRQERDPGKEYKLLIPDSHKTKRGHPEMLEQYGHLIPGPEKNKDGVSKIHEQYEHLIPESAKKGAKPSPPMVEEVAPKKEKPVRQQIYEEYAGWIPESARRDPPLSKEQQTAIHEILHALARIGQDEDRECNVYVGGERLSNVGALGLYCDPKDLENLEAKGMDINNPETRSYQHKLLKGIKDEGRLLTNEELWCLLSDAITAKAPNVMLPGEKMGEKALMSPQDFMLGYDNLDVLAQAATRTTGADPQETMDYLFEGADRNALDLIHTVDPRTIRNLAHKARLEGTLTSNKIKAAGVNSIFDENKILYQQRLVDCIKTQEDMEEGIGS